MKTIKIIDLLNKIAKGERFENCKMKFKEIEPEAVSEYVIYDRLYEEDLTLNDEVEIIEGEKEIKKIKSNGIEFYSDYINVWIKKEETVAYCEYLMNKVNELIDAVNELKSRSE